MNSTFVFTSDAYGNEVLNSVAHDEGRIVVTSSGSTLSYKDHWFVRDHLGSVRTVVDITSYSTSLHDIIIEQNDYLPFGTRVPVKSSSSNLYRYNGKEEQQIAGTELAVLDYGARTYDPWLSRWTSIDPLAAKYHSTSPYVFCNNSPVNYVDPWGMDWIKNIETGYYEWRDNINNSFEVPNNYTYIGASSMDILNDLNIKTEYNTQESKIRYVASDLEDNGFAIVARGFEIMSNLNVSVDILYNSENAAANNILGKTFNGIIFNASMVQQSADLMNPFSHDASASFNVIYGEEIFSTIMRTPNYPYIRGTGEKVINGSIFIPAHKINSNLNFDKALLKAGIPGPNVLAKTVTISWGLMNKPIFTSSRN